MKKFLLVVLILMNVLLLVSCASKSSFECVEANESMGVVFDVTVAEYMDTYIDILKNSNTDGSAYEKVHTDGLEDWDKISEYLKKSLSGYASWYLENVNMYRLDHFDSGIPSNRLYKYATIELYEEIGSKKLSEVRIYFTEYSDGTKKQEIMNYVFSAFSKTIDLDSLQKIYRSMLNNDELVWIEDEYTLEINQEQNYLSIKAGM